MNLSELTEEKRELLKNPFRTYKDKDYKVIKLVKIKSVVTNVWFDGVEYQALYDVPKDQWAGSFVRPLEDFLSKFKPTVPDNGVANVN